MTYYRSLETGKVQYHPKSGLGRVFNAEEIGEDGKSVKPRTSLAPSKTEIKAAKELLRDRSASPLDVVASEQVIARAEKATPSKTSGTTSGSGASTKQEGDQ